MNLETLVTKEYLESRLDARFSEQKAYIDSGFAKLTERIDANFRIQNWMIGFIGLVLILPYLETLLRF